MAPSERRIVGRFDGSGSMVFKDGKRIPVKYRFEVLQHFVHGVPGLKDLVGRVSNDNEFLGRYLGQEFVLETDDGKQVSLIIKDVSGSVAHTPGVIQGFE